MINKQRLIKLAQQLIRINSENPPGNERRIAGFVKDYLDNLGLKTRIFSLQKKRSNLIAILLGKKKKYSMLITPHLDTVPQGRNWRFPPFAGKVFRGRLYGLGATDCKGNLAAGLEVIHSLVEDKCLLDYNLVFAATADEESGSALGLIPILKKNILRPDLAVVLDADDFNIVVAQKGLLHLKVAIKGKRAHGAYPWLGVNAIDIAVDILKELKSYRFTYKKNKYLRPPTLNIGTIKGGDRVNVVADWCEFELDLRFLPGMSAQALIKKLKEIILKYTSGFKIEIAGLQDHYSIGEEHPLVRNLMQAMRRVKAKPRICGSEGATVITFFQDKNIPAVATGFGSGGCAHSANEYIKIKDLYKGALALEEFLKNYKFD
ncbi:M20 family peptidase [bacterium]|nr:MAG: M20 family peptidase [bacterium]